MSFSLNFPDDIVDTILGDDILVTKKGQDPVTIKAPLEKTFESEELADRISDDFAYLDISHTHDSLFEKGTLVEFNQIKYVFYQKYPGKDTRVIVELKLEEESW